MSAAFVLDCSITMAWCFGDEATPGTKAVQDRLLTEAAVVPAHWFSEVANVLLAAERRSRISRAGSQEFLGELRRVVIEVDDQSPDCAWAEVMTLARRHALTMYDAAYLELAIRRRLPLASLDADLGKAARAEGLLVLGA